MMLAVRNDVAQYIIECPDHCEVWQNRRCAADYLVVHDPDNPARPLRLCNEGLIDAARGGDFGLRLLSIVSLN